MLEMGFWIASIAGGLLLTKWVVDKIERLVSTRAAIKRVKQG